MQNSSNLGSSLGALLVGAAIGGALGILFAPHSGIKTRRKISDSSSNLSDSLTERFNGFMEEVKREIQMVKDKSASLMEHDKSKLDGVKAY